jgi:hypothetical protein
VQRLDPVDAWKALLAAPRVLGQRDPALLRTQFETASRLAQHVPVFRAQIPAGPPFDPAVGARVLAQVLA